MCFCAEYEICNGPYLVTMKGINWFGFEVGQTSFDGLWQGPTALSLGESASCFSLIILRQHDRRARLRAQRLTARNLAEARLLLRGP